MKIFGVKVDEVMSSTRSTLSPKRKRLAMALAALSLAGGSIIAASSAPAEASLVYNMMLCDPSTGWCYQTNPPYTPGFEHECQWDSYVQNLHSGMWYTGCNVWWPKIG